MKAAPVESFRWEACPARRSDQAVCVRSIDRWRETTRRTTNRQRGGGNGCGRRRERMELKTREISLYLLVSFYGVVASGTPQWWLSATPWDERLFRRFGKEGDPWFPGAFFWSAANVFHLTTQTTQVLTEDRDLCNGQARRGTLAHHGTGHGFLKLRAHLFLSHCLPGTTAYLRL